MNYDSEEAKQQQESTAEKLQSIRSVFGDGKIIAIMKDYLEKASPVIKELNAKAKSGEALEEEEIEELKTHSALLKQLINIILQVKDVIDEDLVKRSDEFFFNLRKLAEGGDEKAKKMYEKMLPLYKQAHGLDSPELNN